MTIVTVRGDVRRSCRRVLHGGPGDQCRAWRWTVEVAESWERLVWQVCLRLGGELGQKVLPAKRRSAKVISIASTACPRSRGHRCPAVRDGRVIQQSSPSQRRSASRVSVQLRYDADEQRRTSADICGPSQQGRGRRAESRAPAQVASGRRGPSPSTTSPAAIRTGDPVEPSEAGLQSLSVALSVMLGTTGGFLWCGACGGLGRGCARGPVRRGEQ